MKFSTCIVYNLSNAVIVVASSRYKVVRVIHSCIMIVMISYLQKRLNFQTSSSRSN